MSHAASLTLVGASHHTAPVELRERLAFPDDQIPMGLRALLTDADEAFILSTCNRTEVYLVGEGAPASAALLATLRDLPEEDFNTRVYEMREGDAVRHLLRVASGLDSMVLGETQILGQIKDAFERASNAKAVGRVLGRVLPLAIEVGKRARTNTEISRRLISPSSVAVELARQTLGDLRPLTALVLGAGEAGRATARSLKAAGVKTILVANRSPERGSELAHLIGGAPLPYADLGAGLVQADIVIASTGAADHVMTVEIVAEAMRQRPLRPLLCIDIAMPRDIDPEVGHLPGVVLHNIDDLESICEANLRDRETEIAAVETIVDDGLDAYHDWRTVEPLLPTISGLYRWAETIRQGELERTFPRLSGLSAEDRDRIDVMTSSIVRRLLHTPVAALKARSHDPRASELADLARELFSLNSDEPS